MAKYYRQFYCAWMGIMTLPTVFQMFFGKPRVDADFHIGDNDGVRTLSIVLTNDVIDNHFLTAIGVIRQKAENIMVSVSVVDARTRVIVHNDGLALHDLVNDIQKGNLDLPSGNSAIMARILTASHSREFVFHGVNDDYAAPPGDYDVDLTIMGNGVFQRHQCGIHVGAKPYDTYWRHSSDKLYQG